MEHGLNIRQEGALERAAVYGRQRLCAQDLREAGCLPEAVLVERHVRATQREPKALRFCLAVADEMKDHEVEDTRAATSPSMDRFGSGLVRLAGAAKRENGGRYLPQVKAAPVDPGSRRQAESENHLIGAAGQIGFGAEAHVE